MIPHVNVIIATPGHSLMGAYVSSLLETNAAMMERGMTWAWTNKYASHVGDAREITLSGTFNNNVNERRPLCGQVTYDKIIWIDSDIAWKPDDFLRLYESDLDVVSGAYLLESGEVTAYPQRWSAGFSHTQVREMSEPVKVYGVGFGFLAVRVGIFEQLSRPWFQSAFVTTQDENGQPYTFPMMGEDLSWCERVHDLGYDIWLDPQVKVTHHKMMTLSWERMQ
jgi:GT2 family glycosyltransferase